MVEVEPVEEVEPVDVVLAVVPVSEDNAFEAVVPIWDAAVVAAFVAAELTALETELTALERMLMTLVLCYAMPSNPDIDPATEADTCVNLGCGDGGELRLGNDKLG